MKGGKEDEKRVRKIKKSVSGVSRSLAAGNGFRSVCWSRCTVVPLLLVSSSLLPLACSDGVAWLRRCWRNDSGG